ncbi:chorismate mutase [Fusobacterium canifelinum]|uniref:Chorismate mutase n=2 Tax=Fusobacterium canifelinum TaxID=285729 RepID=A0A3P1UPW4_9FUSO|nr:chorismate mutase [Fusobacterium canifelinum]
MMIELELMRKKIDEIDDKLLALFKERLEVSKKIGLLKKKHKMEIFDPQREKEIIDSCTQNISEDEKKYVEKFLKNIMDISKEVQSK